MKKVTVQSVELTLSEPESGLGGWVDYHNYERQLEAAWLRLSEVEPPLNPRLIGEPGLGKTTLAGAVGGKLGREVYIFQCTTDTRPEDLLITPVLAGERRIEYRASALVSAMLRGGLLVLDEGNRMPERSWASLAPLLDNRRSVESAVAAVKIRAHPDFRLCVTMNDDASVYELPGYIQSRLKPKIEIVPPPWKVQEQIVRLKCPGVDEALLRAIFRDLKSQAKKATAKGAARPSSRDILALAHYAQKLHQSGFEDALKRAKAQILTGAPESTDPDELDIAWS